MASPTATSLENRHRAGNAIQLWRLSVGVDIIHSLRDPAGLQIQKLVFRSLKSSELGHGKVVQT